jgi:membrane protein YqaA with SNARE-associated domain
LQLEDIINWMQTLSTQYGYLGIFLISLIGATSIFIPIPYTVIIFTLGSSRTFEPVLIAVAAGIGSGIGEFSGYLLGLGGRKAVSERFKKKINVLARAINKYGPIIIFVFALTPLPDDLIFIPLGIMRYGIIRAFIPALIGKFCMNLIVAYSGRFSIEVIRNIFGIESDTTSIIVGTALGTGLLVIILIMMFKLDWEKYLEKYLNKEKEQE